MNLQMRSTSMDENNLEEAIPNNGNSDNFSKRFQQLVLGNLEKFFYSYGKFVAR